MLFGIMIEFGVIIKETHSDRWENQKYLNRNSITRFHQEKEDPSQIKTCENPLVYDFFEDHLKK